MGMVDAQKILITTLKNTSALDSDEFREILYYLLKDVEPEHLTSWFEYVGCSDPFLPFNQRMALAVGTLRTLNLDEVYTALCLSREGSSFWQDDTESYEEEVVPGDRKKLIKLLTANSSPKRETKIPVDYGYYE